MTVADLTARMSVEEEKAWVEYHALLNEERKREVEKAKAEARMKRGGRHR